MNKGIREVLQDNDLKSIVLAGPGQAKYTFKNALPASIQDKIIAVIDADIHDEPALWQESIAAATAHDDHVKQQLVDQLAREIRTDGLAAYGLTPVTTAAQTGQIDVLLVDKGFRTPGWLCERCQRLEAGKVPRCPTCGGLVTTVDIIEEIIEFATRTDATVTFVESDLVARVGHIAALLRYR